MGGHVTHGRWRARIGARVHVGHVRIHVAVAVAIAVTRAAVAVARVGNLTAIEVGDLRTREQEQTRKTREP
jgi:hypothetical protein